MSQCALRFLFRTLVYSNVLCLDSGQQITGARTDHLVQPHIPHKVGSGIETSTRIQIGTRDNSETRVELERRNY